VIAETWKDVLGTDRCGPGDDFWELGGNSLLAAGLMAELQERLSVNVPISMLWEAPTVPELASLLSDAASPRWPAVVCFRIEASRPPLFVAPGAGSDALALYHLSQAFGEDQRVCALQYRGVDGVQEPHRRIEQAAADYINEIRRIQARGPYWIAGTSFGGLVAFEIARQLLQLGEQVAMLGIIDTRAPGFPIPREDLSLRQRVQVWWRPLLPQANQDSYSRQNIKAGLRQILLRIWARILKRARGSATRHRWRFLYVLDANVRMRNRYEPGQYHGAITLFRSESRPPSELFRDDSSMGWSRYCSGQIQLIDIPGTHGAHIRPPHAASLARELRHVMDSVASEVREDVR
jgi:thioesterase domain-containing protein